MSPSEVSLVCRTCLSNNVNTKSLFGMEHILEQQIILCDMLIACASVSVTDHDNLPKNICLRCIEDLRKAFSFKIMCEKSDIILRKSVGLDMPDDQNRDVKITKKDFTMDYEDVIQKQEVTQWDEENTKYLDLSSNDGSSVKSNDENCENNAEIKEIKTETNTQDNERKRKSYKCEECQNEYLGLASYWKHMANIHGKNFKCDACDKQYKTQALLTVHKISQHKQNRKGASRHKNKTGIIKKRNLPRTCEICNKTFRFHSNLERHKLTHTGEKPFLCNVCGKGFGQMSYLKIHSFIHTGEKPYKCQMCDKSFAAPGTLMTHTRIHTGERPHVCKICGKDFPQSGYLSAHIRTHTGEKPVECKVCHRRFNQSGRLVVHMRIHSGEKPYSCKECGRCFAVKGTLKKHIRTHTGEKPYVCSVCGQAFAQSGTLVTHMKVHRPKFDEIN